MLRCAFLAVALTAAAGSAAAQETGGSTVDFILRPAQDAEVPDDFWGDLAATEEPQIGDAIGPPLAGPTGEERVGPALVGPVPPEQEPPVRRVSRDEVEEEDPFAPIGVAIGTFILRPAIEVGVSATDNAAGKPDKQADVGFVIAPEIELRSQDDNYEIVGTASGEAILYGDEDVDEREADARIAARYAITDDTELQAEAGYRYYLDRFTDPDTPAGAVKRPAVHSFDARLGGTQRFGRVGIGVTGFVDRDVYEPAELADGTEVSRAELDNTDYALRLRTSFEASAALTPFVDATFGTRRYDQDRDDDGFERSSVWGELRGGLIFDTGSKLSGEVALGWRHEDVEDERLEDIDGLAAAASILWSPRRLTEVRFDFITETQPTSIADASGSVLYSGTLSVERRMNPRFTLAGGGGLDYEHFVGVDRNDATWFGFTELTYSFNRVTSLKARYTYEQTDSTDPDADESENTVSLRLRVQR